MRDLDHDQQNNMPWRYPQKSGRRFVVHLDSKELGEFGRPSRARPFRSQQIHSLPAPNEWTINGRCERVAPILCCDP